MPRALVCVFAIQTSKGILSFTKSFVDVVCSIICIFPLNVWVCCLMSEADTKLHIAYILTKNPVSCHRKPYFHAIESPINAIITVYMQLFLRKLRFIFNAAGNFDVMLILISRLRTEFTDIIIS